MGVGLRTVSGCGQGLLAVGEGSVGGVRVIGWFSEVGEGVKLADSWWWVADRGMFCAGRTAAGQTCAESLLMCAYRFNYWFLINLFLIILSNI